MMIELCWWKKKNLDFLIDAGFQMKYSHLMIRDVEQVYLRTGGTVVYRRENSTQTFTTFELFMLFLNGPGCVSDPFVSRSIAG